MLNYLSLHQSDLICIWATGAIICFMDLFSTLVLDDLAHQIRLGASFIRTLFVLCLSLIFRVIQSVFWPFTLSYKFSFNLKNFYDEYFDF